MRVEPEIWLTKSRAAAVWPAVRISPCSASLTFFGARRVSEPIVTDDAVTLLSSPMVIWLSRKTSLMKLTSCALDASMGIPTSAGFQTGQVSPCSSGRPFGLLGFDGNAGADDGPFAMARRPAPP